MLVYVMLNIVQKDLEITPNGTVSKHKFTNNTDV